MQPIHSPWGLRRAMTVGLAVLAAGALTVQQTAAAFSATTANGASNLVAGSVTLSDDDADSLLFELPAMTPGASSTECIVVTYGGSLDATLKLHGSDGGTGLAPYLDLQVHTGSGGAFGDCTGFSASPATAVFDDTLAVFMSSHSSWTNGLTHGSTLTTGDAVTYRVVVTLADDNAAQGLSATPTFTWEAQNA